MKLKKLLDFQGSTYLNVNLKQNLVPVIRKVVPGSFAILFCCEVRFTWFEILKILTHLVIILITKSPFFCSFLELMGIPE